MTDVGYAILALDLNGRILRWNEGARRIFGWTEDDVVGIHWEMLFTPEDRAADKAQDAMNAALELGAAHHERWHIRKSGERFWANGEISPLRDQRGQPVGLVKVLRDRTEEHLAAEALKDAEARLRRAQEAGRVGVFSLDLTTNLLSPTPEFCKIYGLPDDETISIERVEELVLEEDREIGSNARSRSTGASPLNVEYRIRRSQVRNVSTSYKRRDFRDERPRYCHRGCEPATYVDRRIVAFPQGRKQDRHVLAADGDLLRCLGGPGGIGGIQVGRDAEAEKHSSVRCGDVAILPNVSGPGLSFLSFTVPSW